MCCLHGTSPLCPGTSPDVHGGLGIPQSSWKESKKTRPPPPPNIKDCLALPKYFPIAIQPRHSMKRKKGEQRGSRRLSLSWSVCFPLCYLLTTPGAVMGGSQRASLPPAGAGLWVCAPGASMWGWLPRQCFPSPLPALPTQTGAFQAESHGSVVCSDSTSSPLPGSAHCVCFFMEFLAWFCCNWESQNAFNLWSSGCRTRL